MIIFLLLWAACLLTFTEYDHRQFIHHEKTLKKKEMTYQQQINHRKSIQQQYQHEQKTLHQLQHELHRYKYKQNLTEFLNKNANNAELLLQSIEISPHLLKQEPFIEQTLSLHIKGRFHALLNFLLQLEKQIPAMTIQNMNIQKDKTQALTITITVTAIALN